MLEHLKTFLVGRPLASDEKDHQRIPKVVALAVFSSDAISSTAYAVSISAGVAAIVSIPAFRGLADQRVLIGISLITLITLANLRGVKESGRVFAGPTYVYIAIMATLVGYGLFREFIGGGLPRIEAHHFEGKLLGGQLGLLLILKGFSQGAVALTGVEAISNGVPAFNRPESKNAATTLVWMGTILGSLFFGLNVLAHHLRPFPSHDETVLSQMGRAVLGEGPLYLVLQFATAAILTLAANTAYADFPRLSSIIARDGYLPRQFANLGDRLVFSNGILFLAGASALLLWAFGGVTNALIPLYAVGVFTSFTLSQAGMVIHHRRHRQGAWRRSMAVNAIGAVATFAVLCIIGLTRFVDGAYISVIVVGLIMGLFVAIRRHYRRLDTDLTILPTEVRPRPLDNTVVVLVGRVHRGVVQALQYAKALRPNHISALYVFEDAEGRAKIGQQWDEFNFDVPLELVESKYRDLTADVEKFLDEVDDRWDDDVITVVIPEFVAGRLLSPTQLLHNQSAGALKLALLYRKNTVVISVPYHVDLKQNGG